jgi:elongation factor P
MPDEINTNDLRRGMVVSLSDGLFQVLEYQHHKPGKGGAMVRTKLRNLKTGAVLDKTFNSDTKVGLALMDRREMQYLYAEGDRYHFMDNKNYDQTTLHASDLGDQRRFLTEGINVIVAFHAGSALSVDLPTTVDLRIAHTDPGVRGDRSNAGTKPASLEGGASIQVPLFVNTGDKVRVDTRTGEYVTRVQES